MIDARSANLGATSDGRDWCIKALHPSDPLNEIRGIPDESSVPSVFVGYNAQFTLAAPTNAAGSWGFDMTVLPHPVAFAEVHAYDEQVAHSQLVNFVNPQLTGATHTLKYQAFKETAQRWRLAYMGVTAVQDASALSNQGSIVACQTAAKPLILTGPSATAFSADEICFEPIMVWQAGDQPSFSTAQSMPNSYFGASKDGLYMPLRLTRTHQLWHGQHDEVMNGGLWATEGGAGYRVVPAAAKGWPFDDPVTGLDSPCVVAGAIGAGDATSPLCNDVIGHISVQNLALTTKYRFYIRVGFEIQVQPGSLLTPHQQLSPAYDPVALETYFRMNREFKDAYPEEYNSLSKIWEIISRIAKTVAPALSFIPGVGPILATAVPAAAAVGDRIRDALTEKASASMSDRDLASDVVRQVIRPERPPPPPLPPRSARTLSRGAQMAAIQKAVKQSVGKLNIRRRN